MGTEPYYAARVSWEMGQPLLPEHFFAQEGSLREEIRLQLGMLPAPFWGVAALEWDALQLRSGKLCLLSLTLRLPSGEVIDAPGNAGPPPPQPRPGAPRVLAALPARIELSLLEDGRRRVPVYLHWRGDHRFSEVDRDGSDVSIRHLVRTIVLSTSPTAEGTNAVFKLAELEADATDQWAPVPDFLPALLNVTGSPFFLPLRQRAECLATTLRAQLEQTIRAQYLAMYTKLAAQQCLRAVYEFEAFMANVHEQAVKRHPEEVFSALRTLYIAGCVFYEQPPSAATQRYQHDRAGESFVGLLDALTALVARTGPTLDYVMFNEEHGVRVAVLPSGIREAKSVYWLIERAHGADEIDASGVKLAAPSRLRTVHQRALSGVRYELKQAAFRHHFSERIVFHQLDVQGDEWQQALSEGRLVFYPRNALDGLRVFLHWQGSGDTIPGP